MVAKGTVNSGRLILSAGSVADSKPRNAHMVSVTQVVTAPQSSGAGGVTTAAVPRVASTKAAIASTASSGTSLMAVVACCTALTARTPARLISVTSSSTAIAAPAPRPGTLARPGHSTVRLETTATASAALPTQTPIQ